MRHPSTRQAVIEMLIAGAIWGYGFIATKHALESFGPLGMNVYRFGIACLVIFPIVVWVKPFKSTSHKKLFRTSLAPGLCLSALMIFQTWGLMHTSATKSGFITTLYIVLVPIFEVFIMRKRLKAEHLFWVMLALLGTALICDFQGGNWNIGDLLTLVAALCATLHIIIIGKVSAKIDSPMAFNGYQSLVCAVVSSVAFALSSEAHLPVTNLALGGLLFLAIGSTAIAFMLQIRAQQVISASTASLLFLLESPFAALFGFFFLAEVLSMHQWIGAILILISAIMSVRRQL